MKLGPGVLGQGFEPWPEPEVANLVVTCLPDDFPCRMLTS